MQLRRKPQTTLISQGVLQAQKWRRSNRTIVKKLENFRVHNSKCLSRVLPQNLTRPIFGIVNLIDALVQLVYNVHIQSKILLKLVCCLVQFLVSFGQLAVR